LIAAADKEDLDKGNKKIKPPDFIINYEGFVNQ